MVSLTSRSYIVRYGTLQKASCAPSSADKPYVELAERFRYDSSVGGTCIRVSEADWCEAYKG
jgi:hypothetical protein